MTKKNLDCGQLFKCIVIAVLLLLCLGKTHALGFSADVSLPEIPGYWDITEAEALDLIKDAGLEAAVSVKRNYTIVESAGSDDMHVAYTFEGGELKSAQKTLRLEIYSEAEYDQTTAMIEKAVAAVLEGEVKTLVYNEKTPVVDLLKQQHKYLKNNDQMVLITYKWYKNNTLTALVLYSNPATEDITNKWNLLVENLGFRAAE